MAFLGYSFFSDELSLYPPMIKSEDIDSITIRDGEYDQLYISKDPTKTPANWNEEWDDNSVLDVPFTEDFDGGNSGFSLNHTDTVLIKRREITDDDNKWLVIHAKDIHELKDFEMSIYDNYARGDATYVYRISSMKNGIENSSKDVEIDSQFDGMYIMANNNIFSTMFDLDGADTTLNIDSQILTTFSKYPTVVSNSEMAYETGSTTATWIKFSDGCNMSELDLRDSLKYREQLKAFLASRQAFILKRHDGRIWLARCTGTPTDTMKDFYKLRQITFDWVEIGEYDSNRDLYYNNLLDIDESWWS